MTSKHDELFRRAFSDPVLAASAIASVLPAEVTAMIDWPTLTLEPTETVDRALHGFRSDLVFSVRLGARDARVLLLLEHQSTASPWMPFRILQYVVLRWDALLRASPEPERLPLIIPIVWSHARGWQMPRSMGDLVDLDDGERPALGRYVPSLHFEHEDLYARSSLPRLPLRPEAALVLEALRHVRDADDPIALVASWSDLLRGAAATDRGRDAVEAVIEYLVSARHDLDIDLLARVTRAIHPSAGENAMTTLAQLIEKSRAEGRRGTLQRLMRLKFRDAVTPEVLERIEAAEDATLDVWEARILTARTIEDVLA